MRLFRYLVYSGTIAAALLLGACSSNEEQAKNMEQIYKEEGVPVKYVVLQPKPYASALSYHAGLSGIHESSAFASISDMVEKIHVQVGDYVKKDQVLLSFPTDNPAAQYYQAKVAYENARKAYQRMQNLFKSGGISRQQLDNTQAGFEVAEANWDAVRQAVKVKAPISGYVTKINVRESDNVDNKAELFTISQTNRLKTKIWLSEKDICNVRRGLPAEASWRDSRISGKVVQVDMAMDPKMQAFGAVLEFDNPDNLFKCGVTADVGVFTYQNDSAIVVQRKDILKGNDQDFVYVVVDSVARKRTVETGSQLGLDVEVTKGLKPGDRLIVSSQMLLNDGTKIKTIE